MKNITEFYELHKNIGVLATVRRGMGEEGVIFASKPENKFLMKKKTMVWWILGVVAAILILIPVGYVSLLNSMHKATTGYQISTKVLSQLSSIQELKGSVITPIGERYTNDSTICSYQIDGADSVIAKFDDPGIVSSVRDKVMQGMMSDSVFVQLIELIVFNPPEVVSNKFYGKDGTPVFFLDYSPDDFLPYMNK